MKYWGEIRRLDLRNRTDAELDAGYRKCESAARWGLGKMVGGLGACTLSILAAPIPILPVMLFIAAPIMLYTGYKEVRQNIDGMKAHRYEESRRILLTMGVSPQISTPKTSPAATPVFNGEAAVVLDADITTMKTIKLTAKAAPAAQ